jgi:phosphatidylinositol alpha-mannosyltransferase
MKIGLVCPYNLFRGGGVQECVFAARAELERRGHTVKIITPLPRGVEVEPPDGVLFMGNATQVKSFHTTSQVSLSVKLDAVDDMLGKEQFDVLHFHEPWVPMVSMQIMSRSQCANVATFHAKLPETVMTRTIERVITPYTKSIMRYLHGLSAVSEAAADYVCTLTNKPVAIIPNGVDLTQYKRTSALPKTQTTDDRRQKTILYVGRLEKRKGLLFLFKAYERLVRQHPEVRLVIAGEGVDRNKLESYVNEQQIPGVSFLGYVPQEEKVRLLHASDLFCSPARYGESFGIVLLEAMACGLVTVAGNNSGYTGVLRERGALSLVNPKDTDEFVRRLELLLYDEELRALWRSWADTYVKQFSYESVVDQYEDLYRRAIKNRG